MQEKKLWKNGLLVLLIIQALFAVYFIFLGLTDFQGMLGQFGVKYQSDMEILKYLIVYNAFISLSICSWSAIWIRKNNLAGIQTATTLGVLLVGISLAIFFRFNRTDILIVDTPRAILMMIFGILAYREHNRIYSKISE